MPNYPNPTGPQPFFVAYPKVFVVRHVRHTEAGEDIVEDPNRMPRQLYRIDNYRSHQLSRALQRPEVRNIPQSDSRKVWPNNPAVSSNR